MLMETPGHICPGCQPRRASYGSKHKSKAEHRCQGNGCQCGSCYPRPPVSNEQYKTWMATIGEFYIQNSIVLAKMLKQKKLKPE
jgi:hypothetical protein